MVKLKALRQLVGDYGSVVEGQVFEVSEEDAESLEARGLAQRHYEKQPTYQTKVIVPDLPKRRVSN